MRNDHAGAGASQRSEQRPGGKAEPFPAGQGGDEPHGEQDGRDLSQRAHPVAEGCGQGDDRFQESALGDPDADVG